MRFKTKKKTSPLDWKLEASYVCMAVCMYVNVKDVRYIMSWYGVPLPVPASPMIAAQG